MTNYRTISLLTVSSKLFEKPMTSRLSHLPHTNNILLREVYGFRKRTSTENPAFRLIDRVLKSINKKIILDEICVVQQKLLNM